MKISDLKFKDGLKYKDASGRIWYVSSDEKGLMDNYFRPIGDIYKLKKILDMDFTRVFDDSEQELEDYIKSNSGIWDLTDTKEFLIYHKTDIIKILKKI